MQLKIKKYISSSWLITALLLGVMCFTACQKDEDNSVRLDAFGPSPALRGGELRFLGQNLDQVSEVILPKDISVTDITVISNSEIKITLPQNAIQGLVTLKAKNGDLITTRTELTISEPISITKFYKKGTPNVTSVMAGDSVVIEGDYLNLIREVVFADNAAVSLNRKKDGVYPRKQLTVAVPIAAQTGKFAISNGEEMPIMIYTETPLTVAAASATSMTPATIKAGGEITIKGKNLQLVSKVKFQPDLVVDVPAGKDPLADVTEIKVVVPANAHNGDVMLVSYSGLEAKAGTLTMMLPTITSVLPNPVKGGTLLTIKGTNLDLVTNITFPNVSAPVNCKTNTGGEITVDVPVNARGGNLLFNTNSGSSITANYKVVEPVVTSTSTPIVGGKALTLYGTNLDLVASAAFSGLSDVVQITSQSPTSLVILVPNTVFGTKKVVLTSKNGNMTETGNLTISPTNLAYITTTLTEANGGETLTLNGGNFDKITEVTLGGKPIKWSVADASTMFVIIPTDVSTGKFNLVLTTAGGAVSYSLSVIGIGPLVTSIWTGSTDMGGWSGNIQLEASLFTSVEVGDLIKVTVDPSSITGSSQGSFKSGPSWEAIAPGTEYFNISGDFTLTVTADVKSILQATGLIISGQLYIANDVAIVH